jgi:hypothetical protein
MRWLPSGTAVVGGGPTATMRSALDHEVRRSSIGRAGYTGRMRAPDEGDGGVAGRRGGRERGVTRGAVAEREPARRGGRAQRAVRRCQNGSRGARGLHVRLVEPSGAAAATGAGNTPAAAGPRSAQRRQIGAMRATRRARRAPECARTRVVRYLRRLGMSRPHPPRIDPLRLLPLIPLRRDGADPRPADPAGSRRPSSKAAIEAALRATASCCSSCSASPRTEEPVWRTCTGSGVVAHLLKSVADGERQPHGHRPGHVAGC